MSSLTETPAWRALADHCRTTGGHSLRNLLAAGEARRAALTKGLDGFVVDFSKNRVTDETLGLLLDLARARGLEDRRAQLFAGERINNTEGRAALHMALRGHAGDAFKADGAFVDDEVAAQLTRIDRLVNAMERGERTGVTGERFTDIINIGIGGSDLGPRMACRALSTYRRAALSVRFVANVDATDISEALHACRPETTLFLVSSKTFTTQETLTNALTAKRWLTDALGADAVGRHFAAVTANPKAAREFGIKDDMRFAIWDWVGGRYSVWSAVGLPLALSVGMRAFRAFLAGGRDMDRHFLEAPLADNLPVLLGLLGVWNRNFLGAAAHAVLPYDQSLEHLPGYLQQLAMESNGKAVDRDGAPVGAGTEPVLFGQAGTNGQHAFYQLLHQGTDLVSADFIAAAEATNPSGDHHDKLLANCLAQSAALALGRTDDEARARLKTGEAESLAAHKAFPGNRPSTTILLKRLDPRSLGRLVALYEHKTFVEAMIWGLNPFDQYGVELGKELAAPLLGALGGGAEPDGIDPSTRGLLAAIRAFRGVGR